MTRQTISILVPVAALLLGIVLAPYVLLVVFAGILLGVFLRGGGNLLARLTPLGPGAGLAVFMVVLTAAILGFFTLAAANLANQFNTLGEELPRAREQLQSMLDGYPWLARQVRSIDLAGYLSSGDGAASTIASAFGVMGNVVLVIFIGLYCAVSPGIYRRGAAAVFPEPVRGRVLAMADTAGDSLWGWLRAQLGAMAIVGLLTWLGLWALGVPLALVLAVLAGLLAFIPNLGPILSAIPAVMIALSESPSLALWVVALYLAVQALESYVITPQLQLEMVSLPPALTISFQLLMGTLLGILGLGLATPLLAMLVGLGRRHYVPAVTGDRPRGE